MKTKIFFLILYFIGLIIVSGCGHTPDDGGGSPLPWARPESWEGQFKGGPSMNI